MTKNLVFSLLLIAVLACESKKTETPISNDPRVAKLKLPEGFNAEWLYSPYENDHGSWVSMTFDNKGRLIASDQWGALYRLTIPSIGDTVSAIKTERLIIPGPDGKLDTSSQKISIGFAHGLLYAFNSLYVMINHNSNDYFQKGSGMYRLQDTDGDDQYDKISLLKLLDGEGEHGPHSIKLAPDGKSLFVIAGNFTKIPEMQSYRLPPGKELDNLLPFVKDPRGHDNTVYWHGGWIANVDSTGSKWELFSAGFRNPFDLAFNDAGDMFTYDSDMEWDMGTPWYRPTRILHVTSGSEFGWRPGNEKWSPRFADNNPALLNIGQGSPTNVVYGGNANFPEKYRKAIFAFDWSFGIIYAIHLEQEGATYKAKGEEFVSGSPLPLTDGVIGPDGAMYFLTGGRGLESDLYRVYYKDGKTSPNTASLEPLNEEHQIRRKLEQFHNGVHPSAAAICWPYLKHSDRHIRYAARTAIEHQPTDQWINKLYSEKDPIAIIQGIIALARTSEPKRKDSISSLIKKINYSELDETGQYDLLRSIELLLARQGKPAENETSELINYLLPHYPSKNSNDLNRQLAKILVYLDAPGAVPKTMELMLTAKDQESPYEQTFMKSADLIMRNPQYGQSIASTLSKLPPQQQTYLAAVLSQAQNGWTPELREQYFKWFYKAFNFNGGHSFSGFINLIRKNALSHVEKKMFTHYNSISGDSIADKPWINLAKDAIAPKGPGRNWKVDEAMKYIDSGMGNRNFEAGRSMFASSLCISCHTMKGQGGAAGPDLTQLGTRFSYRNMLEAIIEPSKTISDQYGTTEFRLKDGTSILGRMISEDDSKYSVSQNPFMPDQTREISKEQVLSKRTAEVSAMPPHLINGLNPEELKDLLAYLKSGGNMEDTIFRKPKIANK